MVKAHRTTIINLCLLRPLDTMEVIELTLRRMVQSLQEVRQGSDSKAMSLILLKTTTTRSSNNRMIETNNWVCLTSQEEALLVDRQQEVVLEQLPQRPLMEII